MYYQIVWAKNNKPVSRDKFTKEVAEQYVRVYNTKTQYGKNHPVKMKPAE